MRIANPTDIVVFKMKMLEIHLLVVVALHLHCLVLAVFRNCGGFVNAPKGVIQSPNFPNEFPTPILCEWVIYNQQTKFTLIHFTQFYLTSHFTVQYFQDYTNKEMYRNESKMTKMNAYHDVYSMVIPAPYTVLRFGVHELGDINIRVLEQITNVYGFNITYEFVNSTANYKKETCTAYHCSYLGNCLASEDFSEYKCHCFDNFFGEFCHYGPDCNLHTKTNRCYNGGSCSYLNGSLNYICECPASYTGDLCEIKQDACYYLGCEQLCVDIFPGVKGCQCEDGYQLSSDGKSCDFRAHVIAKIHFHFDQRLSITRSRIQNITKHITNTLSLSHVKIIANLTERTESIMGSETTGLTFVISNSDKNTTEDVLRRIQREMKEKDDEKFKMTFSFSQELQIKDLVSSNGGTKNRSYINENDFLTISCIVKGVNSTRFKWYKDGMQIDFSISPRGGYITTVTSGTEGIIRSVLYYARIMKYDQGYFSCVASDGYMEKRRSIYVAVQTTPHIYTPKRQLIVAVNSSVRIPCFSINEPFNSFKYEWFENGAPIKGRTSSRVVESLLPTGTQLFAKEITQNTNFSCRVSNKVGDVNVTVHVLVSKGRQSTCYADLFMGLLWPKTEKGHFTKQDCPPGFGGHVMRSCNCDEKGKCLWDEPSFLNCQSNQLIKIYDKIEVLRQGYRSSNITLIVADLHNFVSRNNGTMHVGDAELVISILRRILEYLWKFPMLKTDDEQISVVDIIGIMDYILTVTRHLPLELKQKLTLGSNVLHISAYLAQKALKKLFLTENSKDIQTRNIDVKERTSKENVSSDLDGRTLTTFTYRNLESHLSAKSSHKRLTGVLLSDVIAIYPDQSTSSTSDYMFSDISININVQIASKEFECLSWTRSERIPHFWSNSSCFLVSVVKRTATCHCAIPVEVIVVGHDANVTNNVINSDSGESLVVILSYVTAICGLLVCLIIYAANWRYLRGQNYVFYTNFILVLLLNNGFLLVCHLRQDNRILWSVGEIAVYFLYITMFTCLLLELLNFYIQTLTSKEYKVNKRCSRFIIIGWGIPIVLTIFFSVASVIFPSFSDQQEGMICWISKSSWQFHLFILPVAVIILAFSIFMCVVWNIRVKLTEESQALFKKRLRLIFIKSLTLLVFSLSESLLGMDLNRTNYNQVVLHSISKICLVFCVLTTRVVFEGKIKHCAIQTNFSKKNFSENKQWRWIQGFLCSFEDRKTHSEKEARNYYDTVNKTKYTTERKRELSSLLGTSTGYGLRKTRADSSGTTSSRTTNTSVNTNVTNVSADVTTNTNSDTGVAAVQINGRTTQGNGTGEFAKHKVLPRSDTREDYFAMYNFPKKKDLTSADMSREYLSMNALRKREGWPVNNFQIIPEVLEIHEAIIH